jgi:hypothetical protein
MIVQRVRAASQRAFPHRERKKKNNNFPHFQIIARREPCRKARVMAHHHPAEATYGNGRDND